MNTVSKFNLRILWLDQSIALSVDHTVEQEHSALTSYFFWPRNDAWSQIKNELESKPWISTIDKIEILNKATLIINYWQESNRGRSLVEAQKVFPEFVFYGYQ